MAGRLDGDVVIVSGGARGIGAAIAVKLAADGARIVIGDVLHDVGAETAEGIRIDGGKAAFYPLDVTDPAAWRDIVEYAEESIGAVTGLVNNAGVLGAGPLESTDLESWNRVLAVNLTGPFLGMQACIPAFRRAGKGAIVNICSSSALLAPPGVSPSYVGAKAALRTMTRSVAVDFAAQGVRANAVFPGLIRTNMADEVDSGFLRSLIDVVPMRKQGEAADVAAGVAWLLSDEARYVTGADLTIDGGWTARAAGNDLPASGQS